jgi:hypothetical protein
MVLLIVKNNMNVQFVEIYGWNAYVCNCVQNLSFFPKKQISQEMFPKLVEKIKQLHVLLALAKT